MCRAARVSLWIWQKSRRHTRKNDNFAFKNFPTEVIFLSKCYTTWCCREASGAKRPLLQANEKQMLGGRDFLLACVCVLQHIPFHLLHVSALLWLLLCRVSLQLEPECSDLARGDGNMWKSFAEFDWPRFFWTHDGWRLLCRHVSLSKIPVAPF